MKGVHCKPVKEGQSLQTLKTAPFCTEGRTPRGTIATWRTTAIRRIRRRRAACVSTFRYGKRRFSHHAVAKPIAAHCGSIQIPGGVWYLPRSVQRISFSPRVHWGVRPDWVTLRHHFG